MLRDTLKKSLQPLVGLTPRQIEYYRDKHRFVVLPAGRRSRKTLISKRKVFLEALANSDKKYFHGAPTRQQAKDIFWNDLKKYTKPFRVKSPSETELKVELMNGTEIHVIGLDRPERIEGQPWNGCHITEIGNTKPQAWGENIRPVLSDTRGFAWLDGVPEGRNHYYDLALYASGGAIPATEPMIGQYIESKDDPEWAYYHWFSSDVLERSEIDAVRLQLDDRTYRQEYEGSFESYEGLAYTEFGEHNFANIQRQDRQISIGMDFNIDPMTATVGHIVSDSYDQFDEIFMRNSNTFEIRDEILRRYGDPSKIDIYPDSTGKHESSNATQSDIAILRRAGFNIRARSGNPFVVDRVNAVNSLIKRRPEMRYRVNPNTCTKTISDFNRVERLPDGRLNKAQEKQGLKHITDALGYLVNYNWPVKKREVWQAV